MRVEGFGKPVTFAVTPGQQHDLTMAERLCEQGAVRRAGPGRARIRPGRLVGDKGYSSRGLRRYLRRRGIRHTIPRRSNQPAGGPFDRAAYRERNRVERLINRLKQSRRIATRYEKRAASYIAMVTVATILIWL